METRKSMMLAFAMLTAFAAAAAAAPQAELWERWTAHEPGSSLTVDHSAWDAFLQEHVVFSDELKMNTIDYSEVSPASKQRLDRYVASLEQVKVSKLSRDRQMAYWLNVYNAKTVQLILDHYPVDSIRDIKLSGIFSRGPWNEEILTIEGVGVTLNDVEHRILRPIWEDPRIHYAVNCASIGCPDLRMRAYTAGRMEQMLEAGAEEYINTDRGVDFDDGTLYLSSIYDWFQADFGGSLEGVFAHLRTYADGRTMDELESYDGTVEYRYDWSLNDFPGQ